MSIEIYCPKCRDDVCIEGKSRQWWWVNRIKRNRTINLDNFDIYDLDRPIRQDTREGKNQIVGYERVCRICGAPLKNKDGKYSYYRRYCSKEECNASVLYEKFNWQGCSNAYIESVVEKQYPEIKKRLKELEVVRLYYNEFILCEECGELCTKQTYAWGNDFFGPKHLKPFPAINVHHKIPVHTLTEENILFLFDWDNLLILCPDCHNKQDHKLSKIKKVEAPKFKTIKEWM